MRAEGEPSLRGVIKLLRQVLRRLDSIESRLDDMPESGDLEVAAESATELSFERIEVLLHSLGADFPEEPQPGPRPVPDPPKVA